MSEQLTHEEIGEEIERVEDFFKRVPDEKKAETTEYLIKMALIWGSYSHYEAMGILEEAKVTYRENHFAALEDTD